MRSRLAFRHGPKQSLAHLAAVVVQAKLGEMRTALGQHPSKARSAVEALLQGDRLAVFDDAEREFRVEGILRLDLQTKMPQKAETLSRGTRK